MRFFFHNFLILALTAGSGGFALGADALNERDVSVLSVSFLTVSVLFVELILNVTDDYSWNRINLFCFLFHKCSGDEGAKHRTQIGLL